jgi:hypothetical protein
LGLTATKETDMPEARDVPLRFIVGADEAKWEMTERLLACLPAVRELVGAGSWRVLEVEAPAPREVESVLEEVLFSLGSGWHDVIALGTGRS